MAQQSVHTESARLAHIYLEMTKIYNSVEMQESRRHILGIREAHKSLIKDDKTNGNISQYAQRIILELLDKHIASVKEDPSAETKYKKSIRFLESCPEFATALSIAVDYPCF